jgi:phage terminase large subunit-like protein
MPNLDTLRDICEADLFSFAQYVNPQRVYGELHKEVFKWLQGEDVGVNQLLLLPRAHMKSHCVAVWCAWWITKHPETTILYVSSTSTLAEAQLDAIKHILTCDEYRRLWPEMTHPEEGKRERWNASGIKVDHPKRKEEGVRDNTVFAAGLTTTTTGLHFDVTVFDDVVAPDNAYTEEGRRKVASVMGQMSSIRNPGGFSKACGTRYHMNDIYGQWKETLVPSFNEEGDIVGEQALWQIKEEAVEKDGMFLWPREARSDGVWFGFNRKVLEYIKAEYKGDMTQFYAQYYNDPNDPESNRVSYDKFEYYDQKYLKDDDGWYFKDKKLNVYAAMDFAFSLNKKADFTAIVVVGVDCDGYIYLLDIDRFKTNKIKTYYEHAVRMQEKWGFRKLRAEVTAAQIIIVNDLKDEFRRNGRSIIIDDYRPMKNKEERMAAILEPRYENKTILHFKGGYVNMLEEEVVLARPPHDDIKDAFSSAIEIAVAPRKNYAKKSNVIPLSKFGGVAFRG